MIGNKSESNLVDVAIAFLCGLWLRRVALVVIGIIVILPGTQYPQNTQTNKNKADQNLKSSARVNPATLAMEFELPLGAYPGRNGQSKSFAFTYSSKVWNLQFFNLRQETVAAPGNADYNHIAYYNTEVTARFADKSVSGWTSNFRPPSLIRWIELYNSAGGLYETSTPGGGNNSAPSGGWECEIIFEGDVFNPTCPSTIGHLITWRCTDEDYQQTIHDQWTCVDIPNGPSHSGVKIVYRFRVELPDGTTKEFRKDDWVRDCTLNPNDCDESTTGSYLSVDGSGMRLEIDEVQSGSEVRDVLYLPDGSKYIFPETDPAPTYGKLVDRNGNTSLFDPVSNKWTDTVGRDFIDPLNASVPQNGTPGIYPFTLKGIDNSEVTYHAEWKALGAAFENPNNQLEYLGPDRCNQLHASPVSGDALFENQPPNPLDDQIVNQIRQIKTQRVCAAEFGNAGTSPQLFNPLVLTAVILPDGSKYSFKYNEYAEITKIVYPTGGYERFEYGYVSPIGFTALEIYTQANRGVHSRFVSRDGITEEQEWTYARGAATVTTAPDGSRTESLLHESASSVFGFEDPRNGMVREERAYDSSGVLRSRTMNDWTILNGQGQNAFDDAKRDPRLMRSVSITFEPVSNSALATLTRNEYDNEGSTDPAFFSHLNLKRQKTYHYAVLNKSEVDDEQVSWATIESWFPESKLASFSEKDYSYDLGYKARGIIGLTIETRVLNPLNTSEVLARNKVFYDNVLPSVPGNYPYSSSPLQIYGTGNSMDCSSDPQNPKICWQNPSGPGGAIDMSFRGLPTTALTWVGGDNWIETHTRYDQFGNVVKIKDPVGNETTTEFSAAYKYAYPTKVISPAPDPTNTTGTNLTSTVETTYDFSTGLPLTVKDEFGQITRTQYDSSLRPWRVFGENFPAPESQTIYGVPNANGLLFEEGEGDNPDYDQRFVKVKKQIEAGNWDEATTWFDGLGRTVKTQAKDSQGDVFVETHYDNLGRVDRVTNPYRNGDTVYWSKTEYDAAGRPFKTFAPAELDNLSGAQWLSETTYSIFGDDEYLNGQFIGMVVTTKDSSNRLGRSITNALGQLLRVDEPHKSTGLLGELDAPVQPTFYKYNAYGKMVEVTQGDQKRWFKYDSLGRLLRVRQPEQEINQSLDMSDAFNTEGDWTAGFAYDILGNVVRATDANGVNIINEYDKASRVTKRCYTKPNVTLSPSVVKCDQIPEEEPTDYRSTDTPTVEFFYDGKGLAQQQTPHNFAKGKLTKVTSSVSETRYQLFDNFGRLTQSSQITDGQTYTSGYQYNLSGALVQETYPSGRVVKNEFESDGDLMQVLSRRANDTFRNYVNSFSYTASGGISQMRLGNGKWETAKFNERLQVYELGLGSSATNAALWKVNYAYGELQSNGSVDATKNTGNIAKQTLTIPGATFVQNYRYDSLYRLKEAVEPGSGSTPNWTQVFDYDRYGNRTAFTQTVNGTTTHNTTPAVSTSKNRFTSTDFVYDNNGNLIQDKDPITNLNRQFAFNADNKQKEVISSGVSVGTYFYDGEGKRVKKVVGAETTVFVYSAGKLVAEYSTTPPPEIGQINYTTTDHLGSPRIITNAVGVVQSRRDFMPFGEEMQPTVGNRSANTEYTAGDQVRQKFTGYQKDEETKLDFAEARMYENRYGRFTAVDPLLASGKSANPQTFNRFIYVGNNPLARTDPTGLDWYRMATGNKDRPYEFKWFDKDPGGDWSAVNFGFFGQYSRVDNFCIDDDCRSAGYLYRDGGADFGERARRIDAYGLGSALKDTGMAGVQTGYNSLVFVSNAVWAGMARMHLQYFTTGRPLDMPYTPYWEAENQEQATSQMAWSAGSILFGGAAARRPMLVRPSFGFSSSARAPQFETGTFSIVDWTGYPEGLPRPSGTFRILDGSEYDAARKLANTTNQAIRGQRPYLKSFDLDVHELRPVKFGGSPTDPGNKIFLPRRFHRSEVTPWWNRLQHDLEK